MKNPNPYSELEAKAFWAPSVARKHMLDISELWSACFPIDQSTKISTFGSCFAQHFSRSLISRGFSWLNSEPAPKGLNQENASRFGYGVFSARTGNIYSTSLLLQWVEWSLNRSTPPDIHWEKDGRFFDPFRPAVEPDGFGSVEEMLLSRQSTIEAFHHAIKNCDLFVFTLGLTESWRDSVGSFEYPVCPGTIAGEFQSDRHVFLNQDYEFALHSLEKAIRIIREAREREVKFLLTVSPVPLTATNSGNHVLVATMESKSTLRAVAAKLSKEDPLVDYFPSYEIINSPVYRGSFFEPNMRSVSPHGVNHVMNTFFRGVGCEERSQAGHGKNAEQTHHESESSAQSNRSDDDITCEEELLAVFGKEK